MFDKLHFLVLLCSVWNLRYITVSSVHEDNCFLFVLICDCVFNNPCSNAKRKKWLAKIKLIKVKQKLFQK